MKFMKKFQVAICAVVAISIGVTTVAQGQMAGSRHDDNQTAYEFLAQLGEFSFGDDLDR